MLKWLISVVIMFLALSGTTYFIYSSTNNSLSNVVTINSFNTGKNEIDNTQIKTIANGLDTPWDLVFLPNNEILFTERQGNIKLLDKSGNVSLITNIAGAKESGEGGLLGITLHPEFKNYLYLYFTAGNKNQIVSYKFQNNILTQDRVIIDNIPGKLFHNGGRIKFGPDGKLYATTGDAQVENLSQDPSSLAGKILRLNDDGSIPEDNPISGSPVYSYGHRNPQGLAFDQDARLWATEHGSSAYDEVNRILPGKNYGWPDYKGDEAEEGFETPFVHSGRNTWAPSGAAIFENSLYFTGLRGTAVYKLSLDSTTQTFANSERKVEEYLKNEFGRLRNISLGPDGYFYILTNNKDGRGKPVEEDDRLIRIAPDLLK